MGRLTGRSLCVFVTSLAEKEMQETLKTGAQVGSREIKRVSSDAVPGLLLGLHKCFCVFFSLCPSQEIQTLKTGARVGLREMESY